MEPTRNLRLKELREERGLSQTRFAGVAGLNPTTVNQIERGTRQPSARTLAKLASALGVSVPDLFAEEIVTPKTSAPPSPVASEEDADEERRITPVPPETLKREFQQLKTANDGLSKDMNPGEEESATPPSMDWAHEMEVREYEFHERLREQGILDFVEHVNNRPYMTSDEVRLLCRWVGAELSRMHHLTREAVLRAQLKASRDYVEIVKFKHKLDKAEPHEALRQEADAPAEAP